MNEAFLVVEVSPRAAHQWLVRGRAYHHLKVGETIFVEEVGSPQQYAFRIESISTYGFRVEELYPTMTGDLLVEGEHGEALIGARMLYIV